MGGVAFWESLEGRLLLGYARGWEPSQPHVSGGAGWISFPASFRAGRLLTCVPPHSLLARELIAADVHLGAVLALVSVAGVLDQVIEAALWTVPRDGPVLAVACGSAELRYWLFLRVMR